MRSILLLSLVFFVGATALANFDEPAPKKTLNPKALDHLKGPPKNTPPGLVLPRREAPALKVEAKKEEAPVDRLTQMHNEWSAFARFLREYSALDTDFVPFKNTEKQLKAVMLNPGENGKDLEAVISKMAKGHEDQAREQIKAQYRAMIRLVAMGQYVLAERGDTPAPGVVDAEGRPLKLVAGRISFDRFHQLRLSFHASAVGRTGFDAIVGDKDSFPRASLQRLVTSAIAAGVRRPNAAHFIRSPEELAEWTPAEQAQFLTDRAKADTHELLRSTDTRHEDER